MQIKYDITVENKEFLKSLEKMEDQLYDEVMKQMLSSGAGVIETHAKFNLDRWGLRKTGNLINSVKFGKVKRTGRKSFIEVGSFGIIYNKIHEFGGIIVPKRKKMLHWINEDGEDVFAKMVTIPARPYLRPAVEENTEEITDAMANVLNRFIQK